MFAREETWPDKKTWVQVTNQLKHSFEEMKNDTQINPEAYQGIVTVRFA